MLLNATDGLLLYPQSGTFTRLFMKLEQEATTLCSGSSGVPRHLAERNAKNIRNWVETFSNLSQGADMFISACDYDLEGSLIGYCILKYACGDKDRVAKRMKFSR
jgi:DNA topoisomerase IA